MRLNGSKEFFYSGQKSTKLIRYLNILYRGLQYKMLHERFFPVTRTISLKIQMKQTDIMTNNLPTLKNF